MASCMTPKRLMWSLQEIGIHRTEVEKWIEWLNPLEDYEALQWLERYSSVDIILKHCADQVEEM